MKNFEFTRNYYCCGQLFGISVVDLSIAPSTNNVLYKGTLRYTKTTDKDKTTWTHFLLFTHFSPNTSHNVTLSYISHQGHLALCVYVGLVCPFLWHSLRVVDSPYTNTLFFHSAVMPPLDYTTEKLVGWRYDPLPRPHSLPPSTLGDTMPHHLPT